MDRRKTWMGFGAKFGGTLGAGRIESTTGIVFNLEHASWNSLFTIENQGVGIGLGGGTVGVLLVVFNCPSIMVLDHTKTEAWDVAFSLGAKLSTLAKALHNSEQWKEVYPIAREATKIVRKLRAGAVVAGHATEIVGGEKLAKLREGAEALHKAYEINENGGKPMIVTLDIPGSGYGLEVGLTSISGYFNLL